MKTVLVVDDSKAESRLMVSLLQHVGINVAVANCGSAALNWLEEHQPPDLIILDIVMPDMSGLDLCRQIRGKQQFEATPIIFCSSKDQEFDRFWGLRQGATAYITKPFVPKELVQTVREYLN